MLKIAVCEDDRNFIDLIAGELNLFFSKKNLEIEIFSYESAREFTKSLEYNEYSIYFFDIELGADDGIELATKVRMMDKNGIFIFVTNKSERVYEVFDINTFAFVRKSNLEKELPVVMNRLMDVIEIYTDNRLIKTHNGDIPMTINDIYYVERIGGYLYIHTDKHLYHTRYRYMTEFPFEFDNKIFFEIYRGLMINYSHVICVKNESVMMKNGDELPISRRRKKEFKEMYKKYMLSL